MAELENLVYLRAGELHLRVIDVQSCRSRQIFPVGRTKCESQAAGALSRRVEKVLYLPRNRGE